MKKLSIHIQPNAKKSEIIGEFKDEHGQSYLKIKIHAPPVDGAANEELIKFLATHYGCIAELVFGEKHAPKKIPKSKITILRGEKSRKKLIGIEHP